MPQDKRPLDELSQEEINQLSDDELMARIEVEQSDYEKAVEYHTEERTRKARIADESFRSTEVTDDYQEWRAAPGRRDFEGVDTIPESRKRERTEQALDTAMQIGLVSAFEEVDSARDLPGENKSATTRGTFSGGQDKIGVREDLDDEQKTKTLSHEIGHAVDYGAWSGSADAMEGLGLGELVPQVTSENMLGIGEPEDRDDPVFQELNEISEDRRGPITPSSQEYRENPKELFADFLGEAIIRPRHTKARVDETPESISTVIEEGPRELNLTQEFFEEELPDSYLPGL